MSLSGSFNNGQLSGSYNVKLGTGCGCLLNTLNGCATGFISLLDEVVGADNLQTNIQRDNTIWANFT